MRTTVTIEDNLLAAAKAQAKSTGRTLGEFIEESLQISLASRVTRSGPPVPVSRNSGGLAVGIDPSSNRALFDALDDAGDLT